MTLPFLRPVQLDDLDTIIRFAETAAYGITSLPRHPKTLENKLKNSIQSFQEKMITPTYENYLFCLEFEKQVIGISGITSRIGIKTPFFAFHHIFERHACDHLKIQTDISLLNFIRARKKPTEIGSLFLEKAFRQKNFGKLLALGRFLFIAIFRNRFASSVIAEIRGFNDEGRSPFWDSVGKHFFQLEFSEADLLRAEHPECVEDLFPKHPIYLNLLPKEAQDVIGTAHPNTIPAKKLLEKQGFKESQYFDIFDAGPHLYAHTDQIHAVTHSPTTTFKRFDSTIQDGQPAILTNTSLDFRATIAPVLIEPDGCLVLDPAVKEVLQIQEDSPIRYYVI